MMPRTATRTGRRREGRRPADFHLLLAVMAFLGILGMGGALPSIALAEPVPVAPADSSEAAPDSTALAHRVIATYFHTSYRCASCMKIEAYTTEAITAGFTNELKEGRLVWRVVNVEEKGNEHFVEEYKLFTKSVILVDEVDGKQRAWKNLPKIWELLGDKERFLRYIRSETSAYLTPQRP